MIMAAKEKGMRWDSEPRDETTWKQWLTRSHDTRTVWLLARCFHRLALPQPRALSYTASTVPSSDVPLNSICADGDLTWNWKTRLMHSRSHDDDDFPSSLVLMIEIWSEKEEQHIPKETASNGRNEAQCYNLFSPIILVQMPSQNNRISTTQLAW
jgi:hypothetical protein